MTWVILILGVVLIVAGLIALFTAPKPTVPGANQVIKEDANTWAEILKELNSLLDKFDQRLRLGVLLVLLGTALVGLAGFIEAKQAKDATDNGGGSTSALVRTLG
jgi:hypothetical protein